MISLLWYFLTCCIPLLWITGSALGDHLTISETLAASICLGTAGAAWIVFVVSSAYGRLTVGTVWFSTLIMVGLGLVNIRKVIRSLRRSVFSLKSTLHTVISRKKVDARRSGHWTRSPILGLLTSRDAFIILFTIIMGCFIYPLYHMRMIPEVDGGLVSANSCYGDLPIHMQIANSFLIGGNQNMSWGKLESPIFARMPLTYPFLADFHAAIFVRLGGTLRTGFLFPGFLMSCSLWALLMAFATRVSRSRFGALLGLILTIGAGGLGGPRWIWEKGWKEAMRNDIVQHDWTNDWIHLWFAFIPHILLPQRGGNFAYPIVMLVFLLVWIGTDEHMGSNTKKVPQSDTELPSTSPPAHVHTQQKVFHSFSSTRGAYRSLAPHAHTSIPSDVLPYAGLFSAMLPLIQAHSFIGIGIIVAMVAICDVHKWLRNPSVLRNWIIAGILVVVFAGPQTLLFRKTVEEGAYGSFFTYGWLFTKDLYLDFGTPHNPIGFMRFWIHSLGLLLPMNLVGAAILLFRMKKASNSYFTGTMHLDPVRNGLSTYGKFSLVYSSGLSSGASSRLYNRVDTLLERFCYTKDNKHFRRLSAWNLPVSLPILSDKPLSRAWDTLKFWLGAVVVFLIANYVNFQPWDRDNSKIYYVFIFISSTIVGPLLALPFEHYFRMATSQTKSITMSNAPSNASSPTSLVYDTNRSPYSLQGVPGEYPQGPPGHLEKSSWTVSHRHRLNSDTYVPVPGASMDPESTIHAPVTDAHSGYTDPESPPRVSALHPNAGSGTLSTSPSLAAQSLRQRAPIGTDNAHMDTISPNSNAHTAHSDSSRSPYSLRDTVHSLPPTAPQYPRMAYGWLSRVVILLALFASPIVFLSSTMSGLMLLAQEYSSAREGYLFDKPAMDYGNWIVENVSPDALIMHSNSHVQPSAAITGYTSFVAYFGWVNNHGYNSYERMDDRNYVMDNLKKISDPRAVDLLRKWGITHISGHYMRDHREDRSSVLATAAANNDESFEWLHDKDLFLDGHVRRIYSSRGWELFEVLDNDL